MKPKRFVPSTAKARRDALRFYFYISPWLIGFLVLTLYPILHSFYLMFTSSTLTDPGEFVGLSNLYYALKEDTRFLVVFKNTLYYVAMFVPASLVLSFVIALMLSQRVKFLGLFRTIFYLPYVTAGVAVTILWGWIFNADYGLLNYSLSLLGIQGPDWLGDPSWAMISIVILSLWTIGNNIIIMLAGIQDIPETLYESAQIDGAGKFRCIFTITIPLATPTIFFNLVLTTIGAFQLFTQPYVLTNGGPLNATRTVVMHLFTNAFQYGRMGYAAMIAWCLFVVIMVITLIILGSSKKWVFYGD
ncbi:MAG TPA: sugar ABC transporter permease [Firmicutes bacterium]|nr:sugar ABC transporter permease [Bacillota bacterium]